MSDEREDTPQDAEAVKLAADEANAQEIKRNEATQSTPRGNVYSEEEDGEPGHEPPPPFPS